LESRSGLPLLLSSVTYSAAGIHTATLGNNLPEDHEYDARNRPASISVGTNGSVYSLALAYWPDSDVETATDSANHSWTYTYDEFNRLSTSAMPTTNPTLAYSYDYDQYGNRWHQTVTKGTGWGMALSFDSNNHIRTPGYGYDAAGNLMMDRVNCYTYDAENRLSSVVPETAPNSGVCGSATSQNAMSYLYDPDGRRVARVNNGTLKEQDYYDAAGHEIAVTNGSGTLQRAEIYAGSRHLATWTNSGGGSTYFNHADWLGTERVRTFGSGQYAGQACETITSLPFGDGLATQPLNGGCGDPSPDHFTGKERDTESGLDNFGKRYDSSSLGRFMTTDPVVITTERLMNPQQLNLYAYVANNPLRFIDPTGEILQCVGNADSQKQCFADLQQIAGDAANRLSMDAKTGVVSFDTKDLDLSKNAGAALVNDLVGSKNTFDFSVGPTIMTDKGPVRIDKISTNMANLPTFGDQPQIGNPPAGVSDILGLNLNNPNMTRVSNTNLKVAPEWTVAFHELAEAYEKIDGGKGGSYAAGHNAALQRELELRDQRPYLKEYNTGAGGPANSPNPQGGIIIKK